MLCQDWYLEDYKSSKASIFLKYTIKLTKHDRKKNMTMWLKIKEKREKEQSHNGGKKTTFQIYSVTPAFGVIREVLYRNNSSHVQENKKFQRRTATYKRIKWKF